MRTGGTVIGRPLGATVNVTDILEGTLCSVSYLYVGQHPHARVVPGMILPVDSTATFATPELAARGCCGW